MNVKDLSDRDRRSEKGKDINRDLLHSSTFDYILSEKNLYSISFLLSQNNSKQTD